MWHKVVMRAEEETVVLVQLSAEAYEVIKKFFDQMKASWDKLAWWGGHWYISRPCATREEAVYADIDLE